MFVNMDNEAYAFLGIKDLNSYVDSLPAGVYEAREAMFEPLKFVPVKIDQDNYVPLTSESFTRVRSEVENFFNKEVTQKLEKLGIMHKRGIIIHGPPGTGKSAFVMDLCRVFTEHECVVLMQPSLESVSGYIECIRKSDEKRNVVIVWDEFDSIVRYNEEELLRITDGVSSIDNLLILGMTNNKHQLRSRIVDRPSRFGLVVELGNPVEIDRINYVRQMFTDIVPGSEAFNAIVEMTEGKSLDHLKEACIQHTVVGISLDELRTRLGYEAPEDEDEENEEKDPVLVFKTALREFLDEE